MNMFILMLLFMYLVSIFSFVYKQGHLLLMLLSLELMTLSGFWVSVSNMMLLGSEGLFSLIFLVMGVCEGVVGLSLLVILVRMKGNDLIFSYNMMKC